MDFNSIKFSKLFTDKHGGEVFNEVKDLIENEKNEKCDNNYIEAVFKVAFMGYFGLDNNGLNNMLRDIDCNLDIKDITEIHKNSIKFIRDYIIKNNFENKLTDI